MRTLSVHAPDGVPEVKAGDDLARLLLSALDREGFRLDDGDVVVVTSKVVSKAEGRVRTGDREGSLAEESVRVVARRGPTTIVRTRHGLTLAAAGVDGSNVPAGSVALLPLDPDASARGVRERLSRLSGRNVAVVVTDTAGRPWREGQTDMAIGAAGLRVLEEYAGQRDAHGNELEVTAPAVADELAGAAELVQGKLGGRPFAVVRGRADLVLAAGEAGRGAAALVRAEGADLFGFGAREAVLRALLAAAPDRRVFGEPAAAAEVVDAFRRVVGDQARADPTGAVTVEALGGPAGDNAVSLLDVLAFAHGWARDAGGPGLRWARA